MFNVLMHILVHKYCNGCGRLELALSVFLSGPLEKSNVSGEMVRYKLLTSTFNGKGKRIWPVLNACFLPIIHVCSFIGHN